MEEDICPENAFELTMASSLSAELLLLSESAYRISDGLMLYEGWNTSFSWCTRPALSFLSFFSSLSKAAILPTSSSTFWVSFAGSVTIAFRKLMKFHIYLSWRRHALVDWMPVEDIFYEQILVRTTHSLNHEQTCFFNFSLFAELNGFCKKLRRF